MVKRTSLPQDHILPRRERKLVALVMEPSRLVRDEALARGWQMVNLFYSPLPEGIVPVGALCDALPDQSSIVQLRRLGLPVVRIGKLPHPDDDKVPAVLPDFVAEGFLAAEHFFERGFRNVGYFGRDPWSDAQALFEGFRQRSEELGMICHLHQLKENLKDSREERTKRKRSEFIRWIRNVPKPLGLLSQGDWIAAVQCTWSVEAGLDVPSDVAVLAGRSSDEICESTLPTLSCIAPDEKRRVMEACDLLEKMMAGASGPKDPIMIPPLGVIERESTNVLATPDRMVASALRYIWDHIDLDLSVEKVADEIGISSRQLARHFQKALGRTVTQELRRKRLEELKKLLRYTEMPIADLAPKVGFRSTTYLHHTFRDAFGMTPLQFRRRQKD
jgi:LacI family transcriptional regulator